MGKAIRQIPILGPLIAGPAPVDIPALPPIEQTPAPAAASKADSAAAQAEKQRQLSMIRARARTVVTEGGQAGLSGSASTQKKSLLGQ